MTKGNCERCGQSAPTISEGPFAEQSGMLDYCEYCSKDLCDDCFKVGHCDDSPDGKHKPELTDDEGEPSA